MSEREAERGNREPRDFADIEALVRATIDPSLRVQVEPEHFMGDFRLTMTCASAAADRAEVEWVIIGGLEHIFFHFGDFTAGESDLDFDPVPSKTQIITDWIRRTESYFRGAGMINETKTGSHFRRRTVRRLVVGTGDDARLFYDT